jgi:hypothetical protein
MRILFVGLILGLFGCNESQVLSGQWFSTDPMPLTYFHHNGDVETPYYLELTLGHYGSEVVGVARYFTKHDQHELNWPACNKEISGCRCNEVVGNYSMEMKRLRLYMDPYCSGSVKRLELFLQGDDKMEWQVPTDDTNIAKTVVFERTLDESGLTSTQKTCVPCGD